KLWNGKSAIDLFGTGRDAALRLPSSVVSTEWTAQRAVPTIRYTSKPVATTASTIVRATILRPVWRVIDWAAATSDSRTIPSGVISNAHVDASVLENPT